MESCQDVAESQPDLDALRRFDTKGAHDALGELFARHRDSAYRLALAMTHNAADAEDAVQAAFLQIVSRKCRFDERRGTSVRGWLMGIVIHSVQRKVREEARRHRREQALPALRRDTDASDEAQLRDEAVQAVRELPEPYRVPVWLHFLERLSFEEIAGALAMPASTVRDHSHRGIEMVRTQLVARGYVVASTSAMVALVATAPLAPAPASLAALGSKALAVGKGSSAASGSSALAVSGVTFKVVAAVVALTLTAGTAYVTTRTPSLAVQTADAGDVRGSGDKPSVPAAGSDKAMLGSLAFYPSPERPIGWRGDWTGRFPGATPPTKWSRRIKGITSELRYQAAKPNGLPGKESRALEYFTVKDWLVSGPFPVDDPVKNFDEDKLGGEISVQPTEGEKVGASTWKFLRADVETQSRQDVNGGTCDQTWIDFIYAFGNCTPFGHDSVKFEGDFTNKIAYAHTYVYAPQAGKVRLQLPMAGAAGRFWLNGKPTDLNPKDNGKNYEVSLNQGWNRLLIKISCAKGVTPGNPVLWRSAWMVAALIEPLPPYEYETTNISWMTKLTGGGMSQPVVVGDRIYIGSGISDLMCINKTDGKVLWIGSNTPWEGIAREDQDKVRAQVEPLIGQLEKLNAEAVKAINSRVSPNGVPANQQPEIDRVLKEKNELERKIHDEIAKMDRKKFFPGYHNEASPSNGTPCSDGKHIYWACGGGMSGAGGGSSVVACWDLEGKRLWSYHEAFGAAEHGCHQSPTLVDGKLIYGANRTLLAFDAKTGAVVWRLKDIDVGYASSPQLCHIGNVPVIFTRCKLVRAADGVVLCDNLNLDSCSTDVIENGLVHNLLQFHGYEATPSVSVVKLPAKAEAGGKAEVYWDAPTTGVSMPLRGPGNCGYLSSPLSMDGILYAVDVSGGMIALDSQAKKGVYQHWLDGYNRFNRSVYGVCASPTAAGKYIYVVDDAGFTHVIQPGAQFKELGTNVLENISILGWRGNPAGQEAFYTSPYFDGTALYLRGQEYLYAIEERK